MKFLYFFLFTIFLLFLMCGCMTPTMSTVTFYKNGEVVKTIAASESVAKTIMDSYKDHTVVWWDNGWHISLTASMATTQDPVPSINLSAGKNDRGIILINAKHDLAVAPALVKTMRDSEIKVTVRDTTASISTTGNDSTEANPDHNIYAWDDGSGKIVFSVSPTPKTGDYVFTFDEQKKMLKAFGTIKAISENLDSLVIGSSVFARAPKSDKTKIYGGSKGEGENVSPSTDTKPSDTSAIIAPMSVTDAMKDDGSIPPDVGKDETTDAPKKEQTDAIPTPIPKEPAPVTESK